MRLWMFYAYAESSSPCLSFICFFSRSAGPSARPKWRGAFDGHHHLIQSIKDISLNAFQFPASVFTAFMPHIRRGRDALDGFCWFFSSRIKRMLHNYFPPSAKNSFKFFVSYFSFSMPLA